MKNRYDFSYEYRQARPKSQEAHICRWLLNDLTEQTMLVEESLSSGLFSFDDIHNLENDGKPRTIFQWAYFPATGFDLRKFDDASIPYIHSKCGTWIGITSFGSSWEIYVVEKLANALFA